MIRDDQFDPRRRRDPYITGDEARKIDSAIDQYNETIATSVKTAREQGRNWFVFDLCSLLDRLAYLRSRQDHRNARSGVAGRTEPPPGHADRSGGAIPRRPVSAPANRGTVRRYFRWLRNCLATLGSTTTSPPMITPRASGDRERLM